MGFFEVGMNAQGTEIEAVTGKPALSIFHGFFSLGGLAGAGASALVIRYGLGGGPGEAAIAVVLAVTVALAGTLLLSGAAPADGPKFALPNRAVLALGILAALGFALEGAFIDWGALFLTKERAAKPRRRRHRCRRLHGRPGGLPPCRQQDHRDPRRSPDIRCERPSRRGRHGRRGRVPWLPLIVLGLAVTGAGAANIVPILFSASARTPGVSPALGIASATTLAYGGFLIAPPLLGFVGQHLSIAVALGLAGTAGLIVAAVGTRVRI